MTRTARSDSPISLGLEETGSWMRKSSVKSEIGGSMPVIFFQLPDVTSLNGDRFLEPVYITETLG